MPNIVIPQLKNDSSDDDDGEKVIEVKEEQKTETINYKLTTAKYFGMLN